MSEETVAQRVIRVIATNKKMAQEELSPANRFEDLKMDSLDALNMIFALEEEFDIDIPNQEAAKMKSVEEVIHGLEELLKAKSSLANERCAAWSSPALVCSQASGTPSHDLKNPYAPAARASAPSLKWIPRGCVFIMRQKSKDSNPQNIFPNLPGSIVSPNLVSSPRATLSPTPLSGGMSKCARALA